MYFQIPSAFFLTQHTEHMCLKWLGLRQAIPLSWRFGVLICNMAVIVCESTFLAETKFKLARVSLEKLLEGGQRGNLLDRAEGKAWGGDGESPVTET